MNHHSSLHYTFILCIAILYILGMNPLSAKDPVDLVDPFVDSANSRWFFFSSACRPFGMVNLSPDNLVEGAWGSGYRYNVDHIKGFSHIHAWQLAGISVLPVVGDVDPRQGPQVYGSSFAHEREKATPGYHLVHLSDYNIKAELTSTTRVGMHRYTFPKDKPAKVILNLGRQLGPAEMIDGQAIRISDTELEGYTVNGPTIRRPKSCPVYFVMQFNQPIKSLDAWQRDTWYTNIQDVSGDSCGALVQFGILNKPLLVKVGISYVSIEQARLNLNSELPHWDFDQVRQESRDEWNRWLSKIEIQGSSHKQQTRFYTDLWHALQGRRIISDVNGKYSDMTGPEQRIRQIPLDENGEPKFNHYNSDSFWGAQWTLNTLWHLVYPRVTEEFCNSMLMMYKDGGLIPRGPSGGNYTYVMTGASSTPFFVSAWMKGIRGFDIKTAYEGLRKNHLPGGLMSKVGYEHDTFIGGGIEDYIEKGYVPYPLNEQRWGFHQDGAGQTLEYAYQDWTLSQLAAELGKEDDAALFQKRAEHYKHLYDPYTDWMRPKNRDGSWLIPFDPLQYDDGWVEATAAQFTYFVPHDVKGLIKLMDTREAFTDKLNTAFEKDTQHNFVSVKTRDKEETTRNRRRYINYGNQPSMQLAFLFNYSGAPWLTQYWSRQVIDRVYSDVTPQKGYSGDEDQGLMGALNVLMKIGLFEMRGGAAREPVYEIGSPIFDQITIHLDERYYPGKTFVIRTKNNSRENLYIQSAELNDQSLNKPWFYHKDLVKGGELELTLGAEPNTNWGSGLDNAPPSMSDETEQ
ncbi:MAG: GH92 family glycosyl hydrolase [candidate division KSB1 bacterium]|nr:GH92 family glycosyl hydrolase [candidate division KSB1 bacterium]